MDLIERKRVILYLRNYVNLVVFHCSSAEAVLEERRMNEQIDIFGGSTPVKDVSAKEKRNLKRVFREMYGFNHGHLCKDCKNLVCVDHHGKRYYKCLLIGLSHSEATDIHLKYIACKRWERNEE